MYNSHGLLEFQYVCRCTKSQGEKCNSLMRLNFRKYHHFIYVLFYSLFSGKNISGGNLMENDHALICLIHY